MAKKKDAETGSEDKSAFRFSEDATITFGSDKDGNAYSTENSPKKGDATKARWSKYRDGVTVKELLADGITRSNIRKDRRAGYITVTNPPEAAPAEAE